MRIKCACMLLAMGALGRRAMVAFMSLRVMWWYLMPRRYSLLRKAFRDFDKDARSDGKLNEQEIEKVIKNFMLPIPMNHVKDIFEHIDHDGNGAISYAEFCKALSDFEARGGAGM